MWKSALLTLAIAAPAPALAQGIPVHDNAALIQNIQQVTHALTMINQQVAQLEEARRLYNDINGITDIGGIASALGYDELRTLTTEADRLVNYESGSLDDLGAVGSRAGDIYADLLDTLDALPDDATDRDIAYRGALERSGNRTAVRAAVAESVGQAVTARAEGLEELRDRLATAVTAKEKEDIQARIQLELAMMENDRLRLQAIELNRGAQSALRIAQNAREREQRRRKGLSFMMGTADDE